MSKKTVVSAAIVCMKTMRLLLAQRSADCETYPLLWCTPGGKEEEGEEEFDALAREVHEEIRIKLRPECFDYLRLVYEHEIVSIRSGLTVVVKCFFVKFEDIEGVPSAGDKTHAVEWFDAEQLKTVELTPADAANRDALIQLLESSSQP